MPLAKHHCSSVRTLWRHSVTILDQSSSDLYFFDESDILSLIIDTKMSSTGLIRQHRCDTKIWSVVQIRYVVFMRILEFTGKFSAYKETGGILKWN